MCLNLSDEFVEQIRHTNSPNKYVTNIHRTNLQNSLNKLYNKVVWWLCAKTLLYKFTEQIRWTNLSHKLFEQNCWIHLSNKFVEQIHQTDLFNEYVAKVCGTNLSNKFVAWMLPKFVKKVCPRIYNTKFVHGFIPQSCWMNYVYKFFSTNEWTCKQTNLNKQTN